MNSTLQAIIGSRTIPWLLLAATLGATGVAWLRPRPQPGLSPRLEALSVALRDRGRDLAKGLELIVTGDPVMGDNLLASASDRMSVLAQECVRTAGCDGGMLARALGAALAERTTAAAEPSAVAVVPRELVAQATTAATAGEETPSHQRVDLEQVIPFNGAVKRALDDWLTWNRPQLADAYENYRFLRAQIAPVYAKAGLPEALLFGLMAQETGGKVHAYSSAGAVGPLQFMPTTGRRYGLEQVGGFDMRLDPVAATKASAAYLTTQLDRFDGDLPKALAAYNAGESRLATLHRRLGGTSFWDAKVSESLPMETRNYVPAVLAASWIFMHAEDYGLSSTALEVGTTTITLAGPVSIGELTICLGAERNRRGWFRTLRNLNPRMSGDDRIDAGEKLLMPSVLVPVYVKNCSATSPLLARARELHDGSDEKPSRFEYALQEGNT